MSISPIETDFTDDDGHAIWLVRLGLYETVEIIRRPGRRIIHFLGNADDIDIEDIIQILKLVASWQ